MSHTILASPRSLLLYFDRWRRGFKIRPPAVSSYSLSYPGNDYKRTKYVKDLRISAMETINRSIEAKEFQIHRKFPKHESLWDCVSDVLAFGQPNVTCPDQNLLMLPFWMASLFIRCNDQFHFILTGLSQKQSIRASVYSLPVTRMPFEVFSCISVRFPKKLWTSCTFQTVCLL